MLYSTSQLSTTIPAGFSYNRKFKKKIKGRTRKIEFSVAVALLKDFDNVVTSFLKFPFLKWSSHSHIFMYIIANLQVRDAAWSKWSSDKFIKYKGDCKLKQTTKQVCKQFTLV